MVAEPKYELAGRFRGGYAQVVAGDKMGLIDREGNWVFEPTYGYIGAFGAEAFKASTGRKLCGGIAGVSIDGEHLIFGECASDWSAVDVQRLAGDRYSGRANIAIMDARILGHRRLSSRLASSTNSAPSTVVAMLFPTSPVATKVRG